MKNVLRQICINLGVVYIFFASTASMAKELDCMVKPEMYVELSSPVDGILDSLLVENNSSVKKGQVLATLESSVETARVKLAQQEAIVGHIVNSKQVELEFTERNKTRYKDMYAKESAANYEADRANTDAALAKIALDKSLADKKTAELQLQLAIAQLEQKSIKSPITGIVVERYVMPGESVNGRAIMKLAQVNPLRVELVAPAELFGQIHKGMTVEIKPEKPANQSYRATVSNVDQLIDPASGSFKVRLSLPNPDEKLVGGVNCVAKIEFTNQQSSILSKAVEKLVLIEPEAMVLPQALALEKNLTNNTQHHEEVIAQAEKLTLSQSLNNTSIQKASTSSQIIKQNIKLAKHSDNNCYEYGPFSTPELLNKSIKSGLLTTQLLSVVNKTQEKLTGFMVFYPPAETHEQALINLGLLKKQAGKDLFLFSNGPLRDGIALGHFKDEVEATQLAQKFINKGYQVTIRPQHKTESGYYARLIWNQSQSKSLQKLLATTLKQSTGYTLQSSSCTNNSAI